MIGPILIITGLYWLWVAFKGKAGPMLNAITGNSGFDSNLDALAKSIPLNAPNVSGNNNPSPVSGNTSDSGTHMGIDPNGNIITIHKSYDQMTSAEKDAANTYAHKIGNINA